MSPPAPDDTDDELLPSVAVSRSSFSSSRGIPVEKNIISLSNSPVDLDLIFSAMLHGQ